MGKNKFNEIVLKEKERRLSISRVPKKTKEEFVEFANEEFEEDYGMCLKYVWDNFKLWKIFFENMDMKLNNILEIISQRGQIPEPKCSLTMLSGRKIKGGKVKDGSTK